MAQRALPPGTIQRRTFFGLLDAEGWGAAFLKALFWFALIIFLLGYLPDRAYYFTVFPTIDVGTNFISPVNLCDGSNKDLPCPAPAGAVVPWEASPSQLALPAGLAGASTVQSGTHLYLVGGTTAQGATDQVLATDVTSDGNFGAWQAGPKLPAPRSNAAVVTFNGTPYVIGGLDQSGKPTDTVYVGTLDNGALTGWKPDDSLKLPTALSDASAVAGAASIWVIGGKDEKGISATVYRSILDSTVKPPALKPFVAEPLLTLRNGSGQAAPRADALAVSVGNDIYVVGGTGPQGASADVFRIGLDTKGEPLLDGENELIGWGQATGAARLPAPRTLFAGFTVNSAIYVPGGADASGAATRTLYWTLPDALTGDITEWHHLDQTDLPQASIGAAPAAVGAFAFLIGGDSSSSGPPVASSVRADLAPKEPFFRLGLFGATLPALAIKGEIGQQLGYLNAFTLGLVNFAVLILIGLAYSHQRRTRLLLERLSRGRYRAPREDEYLT